MCYIAKMCSILMVLGFLASLATTPSTASLVPVPGSSSIYQKLIYNIVTPDGTFLDLDPEDRSFFGRFNPSQLFYRYRQEIATLTSYNFVFIERGGQHPGLAGFLGNASDIYRFLEKSGSTLVGDTVTVFKPKLFCYTTLFGIVDSYGCREYIRFSLKQASLGKEDPEYYLMVSDNENLESRNYIGRGVYPSDAFSPEKRYVPTIVSSEAQAVRFKFIPAVEQVTIAVVRFNAEGDITGSANDVRMATDEVVINRADVVVDHVYTKTILLKSSLKLLESWSVKVGVMVSVEREASVGFLDFFSAKSKTKVEGHASAEFGGKRETVITSEEEFEVSQTITVQPNKAVRCSSWLKVVQGAQMPYRAEAIVKLFFKELDPHSGELVTKAMPPQLALGLIPYYVKGWTVLKVLEHGVLVEMSGSMRASFGVSAFFGSENMEGAEAMKRYGPEKAKGMFSGVDKRINPNKMEL